MSMSTLKKNKTAETDERTTDRKFGFQIKNVWLVLGVKYLSINFSLSHEIPFSSFLRTITYYSPIFSGEDGNGTNLIKIEICFIDFSRSSERIN